MKHVVWKFFTFGAYEREEQWLNQMAARGLMLTDVYAVRYVFEEGTPGEYVYRIELLNNLPSHPESAQYLRFLGETGVERVGSYLRWVYLRRKTAEGGFELYSDLDSRIRHYKRVTLIATAFSTAMLCFAVMWVMEGFSKYAGYLDWTGRGFACRPYHLPLFFWSAVFVLLAAAANIVVLPVRKALRRLKKEKTIRE